MNLVYCLPVASAKIAAIVEKYMAISRGSTVAKISHFNFYHQKYEVSKSKIKIKKFKLKLIWKFPTFPSLI